jgi:hypothetical protein
MPASALKRDLLVWLDELGGIVGEKKLGDDFAREVDEYRTAVRAVDMRDEGAAKGELMDLVRRKIVPLENRIKAAIRVSGPGAGPSRPETDVERS